MRVKLKYPDVETFIQKYSVNISRGGIFIATKNPKPVGTALKFEFVLSSSEVAVRGEGVVQWTKEAQPGDPRPAGMGIRFTHLDSASQEVVDRALSLRRDTPPPPAPPPSPPPPPAPARHGYSEEGDTATGVALESREAFEDDNTNPMAVPMQPPEAEEPARELSIEAELPAAEAPPPPPPPRFAPARTVNILEARTEVLPPAEAKGKAVTSEDLDALADSWNLDRQRLATVLATKGRAHPDHDAALRALEELARPRSRGRVTPAEAIAGLTALLGSDGSKP